ncbi:MAG: tetratricopeptide repeat protein [Candidatus Omnitrophica bacterium]|nr:tetratricopeptide repeat protein [Candidatus Omnitrophota bacterium]
MKTKNVQAAAIAVLVLFWCAFVLTPPAADAKEKTAQGTDDRLSNDLRMTRDELLKAQDALTGLKGLYAEKEIQTREFRVKLEKLQESFRRSQEAVSRLAKEKEILAQGQTKLALQLKSLETEKFILKKQNELLSTCSAENGAKTKELAALRTSCAQEKKEFLTKKQEYEEKIAACSSKSESLAQRKSELEIKHATAAQAMADYKNLEIGCLAQKEALVKQVHELQRQADGLRKDLSGAETRARELDSARAQARKQQGVEEELGQVRRNFAQLQNELKQAQDQNKKLSEIAARYDKQATVQEEIYQVRKQLSAKEDENDKLKIQAAQCAKQETLKKELEAVRNDLVKTEEQKARLEQTCGKAKKQQQELEAKFSGLTKKLADLQDENRKLQETAASGAYVKTVRREIEHLRDELARSQEEKKKVEQFAAKSQQDIRDTQTELAEVRQKLNALEAANQKLQKASGQAKVRDAALQEVELLRQEVEQLRSENRRLKERADSKAQSAARAVVGHNAARTKEVVDLNKKLQLLQGERDRLADEVMRLRKQQLDLVEQCAGKFKKEPVQASVPKQDLPDEIGKLKEELATTQELSYQLVKEKADSQKREKTLSERFTELQAGKDSLEREKRELEQKNKELEGQYEKLSAQLARLMVQYGEAEKEKQRLSGTGTECRSEVLFVQNKLEKSEQLISSLQLEVENLKKENRDLNVKVFNEKVQKEQDVALVRAQLEQLNALKEGEYVQLSNRFQDYRTQKDAEVKSLNDDIGRLKAELANAQELSFQMVQEKSSLQGQAKSVSERLRGLEDRNTLLDQQKKELEKQNAFLKDQYVSVSQEIERVKLDAARLEKAKIPREMERCTAELDGLKRQFALKDEEYLKKIKEYETKYRDFSGVDRDKREIVQDLAKLRNDYEELQRRYEISEKIRKDLESVKERYGSLPEENANLHYNLGVLYAQDQNYQKAVAELQKVVELRPADAEAYYNLGVIYGEYLNDRKKGLVYLQKFLDVAPNDPEADKIRKYLVTWKAFGQETDDVK